MVTICHQRVFPLSEDSHVVRFLEREYEGKQARANSVTPATSTSRRPTASAIRVSDPEEPA
jgi:hypothetical protein